MSPCLSHHHFRAAKITTNRCFLNRNKHFSYNGNYSISPARCYSCCRQSPITTHLLSPSSPKLPCCRHFVTFAPSSQQQQEKPTNFDWNQEAEKHFHWQLPFNGKISPVPTSFSPIKTDTTGSKRRLHPRKRALATKSVATPSYFSDGRTNVSFNCLDEHVLAGRGDKIAVKWISPTGTTTQENDSSSGGGSITHSLTYQQLLSKVCKMSNVLRSNHVKQGDTVTIFLPKNSPMIHIAALACSRIGAIHEILWEGLSEENLAYRIFAAKSHVVLTSANVDSLRHNLQQTSAISKRKKLIQSARRSSMKKIMDDAIRLCRVKEGWDVKTCLVHKRGDALSLEMESLTQDDSSLDGAAFVYRESDIDVDLDELMVRASSLAPVEWLSAEHGFMLSGTEKSNSSLLYSTGGYMVYTGRSFDWTICTGAWSGSPRDGGPNDDLVFCCAASSGSLSYTSMGIYGPLLNGVTTVVFEGDTLSSRPISPHHFWNLLHTHSVNQLYAEPMLLRELEHSGIGEEASQQDTMCPSLCRIVGPLGIDDSVWEKYYLGRVNSRLTRCTLYLQAESGSCIFMSSPENGSHLMPLPGIVPELVADDSFAEASIRSLKHLFMKSPWPGVARTLWHNAPAFQKLFLSKKLEYFDMHQMVSTTEAGHNHADCTTQQYIMEGSPKEMLTIHNHTIPAQRIESAIMSHEAVCDCVVVPVPHKRKGHLVYAFVRLYNGYCYDADMKHSIMRHHLRSHREMDVPVDVIHWAPEGIPRSPVNGMIPLRDTLLAIALGEYKMAKRNRYDYVSQQVECILKEKGR